MRIALVNDLPMAVEVLRRTLALQPQHHIAWTASNGAEAVEFCLRDTPDLILMDIVMPEMDGAEATRQIMAQCPCAILIVTIDINAHAEKVCSALGFGALDAVNTPPWNIDASSQEVACLLKKIDIIRRLIGIHAEDRFQRPASATAGGIPLVVIGASAGGPAALAEVIGKLPPNFPGAVVVVQHIDEQFAHSLANWLALQSALPVHPAAEGDAPRAGCVLLAVRNTHLVLSDAGQLAYTEHPQHAFCRPSIDTFFESVAKHWKGEAVGVILSGMGRDGALGLKALRDAGFHTIAQNEATCAVYGMPKAAALLNAAAEILPLQEIAATLGRHCRANSQ